jgi:type I restriction enzyme S subunit
MEKQKNIPKVRFPEFTGEWERKKLGEVAERVTIKNNSNNVKNVFTNSAAQGIVNQRDFFDKDIANQNNLLNYFIVEKDDFIYNPRISNYAPVGPISRNHIGTGVMSPLYSVFKFKDGELDFLETYFSTTLWYEYLESIANYGARFDRMNITIKDFYEMPLPFPSLPEQKRIASFFTDVDKKISELKQKKNLLEQYKKGVMQKIFSQELRFKPENGKEFPKWEKKTLGEITESISSGKSKINDSIGEYPLYGSTGIIGYSSVFEYSGKNILIARVGANAGTLYKVEGNYSVTDNTLILKLSKIIEPDFMFYLLLNWNLNQLVFGSGQPLITGGQLKALNICYPSIKEQTKIANFLSAIDEKINRTESQIQHMQDWKKGLLQKMFV